MQYTLSIIKPDAMAMNLADEINQQLEEAGLSIVKQKQLKISKEQAEEFYAEHKGKPFFFFLVSFMSSGDVIVQVQAGPNAIETNREVMGVTDPKKAAPGTIRNKYGTSIGHNCIHGSDSPQSAKREISLFFDYNEIAGE